MKKIAAFVLILISGLALMLLFIPIRIIEYEEDGWHTENRANIFGRPLYRETSTSFKAGGAPSTNHETIHEIRNCALKAWAQQEEEFFVCSSKAGYPVPIMLDRAMPGFSNKDDVLYEIKISAFDVLFGIIWMNPQNGKCFHLIGPRDYAALYKEPVVEFREKKYEGPMSKELHSALKAKIDGYSEKIETNWDVHHYKLAFSIPNFSPSGRMFKEYVIRDNSERITGIYWFSEDGDILEVLPFLDTPPEEKSQQ